MAAIFQGKRVSWAWDLVLRWAIAEGIEFVLNSGRRNKAEQLRLIREKGLWSPSNPTGAAPYSPNAPHIRVGRIAHALDVSTLDGGETRLERWVESKGVDWRNTVPGEAWHGEVSEIDLLRLARRARKALRRLNDPLRGYPRKEARWIREYDDLKRRDRDAERRQVLARFMRRRAAYIRTQAEKTPKGWERFRRRDRYRSLKSRS